MDAGVKLADVQAARLERYLLRLATNFTARRNQPLPYAGKGRKPVYGEKIRPLPRSYKGKTIAASSPDRVETWTEDGAEMRAEIWEDLILPGVIPGTQAKTFRVYAIYDPAYTYNHANRLTAASGPSGSYTYGYNGLGDRLQQVSGGITTRFVLDLTEELRCQGSIYGEF